MSCPRPCDKDIRESSVSLFSTTPQPPKGSGVKEYGPEELAEIAFSLLEKAAKEWPRRIVIGWTRHSYRSDDIGKVGYIQVCEHEIFSERDNDRWQEWVQVDPIEKRVSYCSEDGDPRDVNEIIGELKELNEYRIGICAKILKKLNDTELIVKVLDRFFLVRTDFLVREKENMHRWFLVRNDRDPSISRCKFFEVSKKEILPLLV